MTVYPYLKSLAECVREAVVLQELFSWTELCVTGSTPTWSPMQCVRVGVVLQELYSVSKLSCVWQVLPQPEVPGWVRRRTDLPVEDCLQHLENTPTGRPKEKHQLLLSALVFLLINGKVSVCPFVAWKRGIAPKCARCCLKKVRFLQNLQDVARVWRKGAESKAWVCKWK